MSRNASPQQGTPAPPRSPADVLSLAAPTTTRYLAFLAAVLSVGIFVGSWGYNQTQGRHWAEVVVRCAGQAQQASISLPPVQAELAREALEARCRGAVEVRRAAYGLGGAGAVGVGALIVVYLAPVVVRRRRRLRALGSPLHEAGGRVAELAAAAGIRRMPLIERGPASQRDAFSYGAPGRPRIVLPPAVAVRWRDRELLDPLVRHELAHVRHHDVALAWLARSAWYALAPLLGLPVVVSLVSGDHSIVGDLIWRTAVLGLTVLLVSAAMLRSREHDADLRAAQFGSLSIRYVVNVAQAPLALGLLFCLIAALAGLIPRTSRSPGPLATARVRVIRLLGALVLPAVGTAAASTLLIVGRSAVVGPPATLISANSGASSVFTAARLDGLRYLNSTAPAIEAAYARVPPSADAAAAAASSGLAATIIQTRVLPQLRQVLHYAESVRPGTTQVAAIHRDCLAAFQDSITEYTLFAQALRDNDASAFDRAKTEQRAANAEWTRWQTELLSLRLGGGIPVTP